MKFEDLNIAKVGHQITMGGIVLEGDGLNIMVHFPDNQEANLLQTMHPTLDQWKILLRQMDMLETEILARDTDGKVVKANYRKCQRNIDGRISWRVFHRDGYTCRYCGAQGVPMSVDHLVLWEEGGPSTEPNLLCSCKKCNNARGKMQYGDWLDSRYYQAATEGKKTGPGISSDVALANDELLDTLDAIPRVYHKRSR